MIRIFLVLVVLLLQHTLLEDHVLAIDEVRFNEHIRPILAESCFECHGPDASRRGGDLRLDLESSSKIHAIVPHQPNESELFLRISSTDPEQQMPPADSGKKLTSQEIELIRIWIEGGARFEGHWAFEPVKKPHVPEGVSESYSAIDRFLLERLQARGLSMSPPISRRDWIRRATFDLIGVPPSWDEVESFVNDSAPDAYEQVIDRLLDSPRYGERWGRYWLDVARYADTHGGSAIGFTQFPFSYTYRDYVIQAFNKDLPYDRFVIEQLAADHLGLSDNDPSLAALGFLTVGMQYRNRHDVIDDQIDVVTRGLQGLTVACARCHDHKFDAISTADYYALYATFASSHGPEVMPIIGEASPGKSLDDYQRELVTRQGQHDDMARDQSEVMRGRLRMQVGLYLRELAKGTPEQDVSSPFLSYRTDDLRPLVVNRWRDYLAALPDSDPVFGPWHRLARLESAGFAERAIEILQLLQKANGESPAKPTDMRILGAKAPLWNPRVLEAIATKQPKSMLDVADAYGELLGRVHQEWLKSLQEASSEAAPDGVVVPDEDERHLDINSPIHRELRRHLYGADTPTAMPDSIASRLLNRTVQDSLGAKRGAIHQLDLTAPGSPPRAMIVREDPTADDFHVFRRGQPLDRGEPVRARFLSILAGTESPPFINGKRRLGLAAAITARDNPLTRRVLVNWVWQQHFGQGLVRTPDDFGTRGQPPTHPELLDYLAEVVLEEGWSLKKLHRRIMLTAAYRQAAREDEHSRAIDPDNELLWRMPRRRLDLEAMRDALLVVSGELDTTMGGRPIDLSANPVVPRRSVYGFVNRDIVSSLLSTFDGANPNACTVKRPSTSVPQQTLFALNSEFIQDRAAKLAEASQQACENDTARIRWLYQRVYSRIPDEEEQRIALHFVHSSGSTSSDNDDARAAATTKAWQSFAHVLLAANEFVFVD